MAIVDVAQATPAPSATPATGGVERSLGPNSLASGSLENGTEVVVRQGLSPSPQRRSPCREIWGQWQSAHEPLPEGESFHRTQFSFTDTGSKPGKRGRRKGGKGDDGRWRQGKNQEKGKGKDDGRWRQEWNNTIVDDTKHWRREAAPERMEVHGKSAPERTEAAQQRHRATGRYGHGRG